MITSFSTICDTEVQKFFVFDISRNALTLEDSVCSTVLGKNKKNVEAAEDIRTPNNKIQTSLQLHSPFLTWSTSQFTYDSNKNVLVTVM